MDAVSIDMLIYFSSDNECRLCGIERRLDGDDEESVESTITMEHLSE